MVRDDGAGGARLRLEHGRPQHLRRRHRQLSARWTRPLSVATRRTCQPPSPATTASALRRRCAQTRQVDPPGPTTHRRCLVAAGNHAAHGLREPGPGRGQAVLAEPLSTPSFDAASSGTRPEATTNLTWPHSVGGSDRAARGARSGATCPSRPSPTEPSSHQDPARHLRQRRARGSGTASPRGPSVSVQLPRRSSSSRGRRPGPTSTRRVPWAAGGAHHGGSAGTTAAVTVAAPPVGGGGRCRHTERGSQAHGGPLNTALEPDRPARERGEATSPTSDDDSVVEPGVSRVWTISAVAIKGSGARPAWVRPNAESAANSDPWLAEHHAGSGACARGCLPSTSSTTGAWTRWCPAPAGDRRDRRGQPLPRPRRRRCPPFLQYQLAYAVDLRDRQPPAVALPQPARSPAREPVEGGRASTTSSSSRRGSRALQHPRPNDPLAGSASASRSTKALVRRRSGDADVPEWSRRAPGDEPRLRREPPACPGR
jgi:hypothetical protein